MNVSVLVLTLNEAINIEACLNSVSWSDDLVVLDSKSSDSTMDIARRCGARVVERVFDNWSAHQNWATSQIQFRHPWVFYLDADERCTPELRDEILRVTATDAEECAFRMRRRDFFMGRWLKHAQLYPTWLVRLFRPGKIRYERLVNPVAVVDGKTGVLTNDIHHFPFSHGIKHWINRHNNYSDLEAEEVIKVRAATVGIKSNLFSRDPNKRRSALKEIFYRMPARPIIKFTYYYFIRRGFLDGRAGLTYAALQAVYEFMIDCKYRELLRRQRGLPV